MFCHLHVHDQYSLLDGFGTAENYAKRAKELDQKYLALTNHGNIDGLIKFQKACKKQDIIPICGCEAYIVEDAKIKQKGDDRGHITLLVHSEIGFQNLCKMLTYANLEGFYYRPRIDYDMLYDNCEGLIVLTGCAESFLLKKNGQPFFDKLQKKLQENIYLEIMPHIIEDQLYINKLCVGLANNFDIPLIGTNDCHYISENDSVTQEVLLAMQTEAKWNDPDRFRFNITGLHLRSEQEMKDAFIRQNILSRREIDEAIETTIEIAEKCSNFSIKKQGIFLPKVPGYESVSDPNKYIWTLCKEKLIKLGLGENENYLNRLDEECEMIKSKNFSLYFLIVWELINWCKANDIMTGPGRGSVGGSLTAYLLGITSIDPLKFDLLFSRFISEDRIDFPDIDVDFSDYQKNLVREHLEELYGKNNISSISTFLTMKGKAVIRDVARVFNIPIKEVDEFAKDIEYDDENGTRVLETAIQTSKGRWFNSKYPEVVQHAIKLEGQIKARGQHAAGLIISADDLTQGTKGNLITRADAVISNWDMEDSEYIGLMKLDVLGLNTLSVLNETKNLIKQNKNKMFLFHPESDCYFVGDEKDLVECFEVDLEFEKIPLNDQAIYDDLANGHTVGVFQLSAWPTTKLAKEIQADNFTHLSDVIALVRPGPFYSGMTEAYIKRKRGEAWIKKNPLYERITENTFGVIVYQEQIMEVINKVAGLPYSTADKIRKIISKKRDAKEFEPFKEAFINGCLERKTLSKREAESFWKELQEHASYSFNKSHSVAYAMLGYWCAWIKHYFPTEFICANLSYGSEGKKEEMIEEAYRLGLELVLPQIGISDAFKWIARDNKLYCPFIEIKGIGEKTAINCTTFQQSIIEDKPKKKSTNTVQPFFNMGKEKKAKVEKEKTKSKLELLLTDIGAFGNIPAKDIDKYFSFNIKQNNKNRYPGLIKKLGFSFPEEDLDRWLTLDIPERYALKLIKRSNFINIYTKELGQCYDCELSKETNNGPVWPSTGKYNITICGEAPGKDEDEKGEGFIGKAGQFLWKELDKYGLYREDFHVTNCCKCWPSISKTPNKSQIQTCHKWIKEEMIRGLDPCLILAFGNTSVKAFTNRDSGITDLSGKTEWNEKAKAWICWCIHPSAVLHNPSNKQVFENGIKNFSEKITLLGDLK